MNRNHRPFHPPRRRPFPHQRGRFLLPFLTGVALTAPLWLGGGGGFQQPIPAPFPYYYPLPVPYQQAPVVRPPFPPYPPTFPFQ